jgi:hypothetical protein
MSEIAIRGLKIPIPGFVGSLFRRRPARVARQTKEDTGGAAPIGPLVSLMICNDVTESMFVRVALQSHGIAFLVQGDSDPFRIMCPSQLGYCTLYVGQSDLELALDVVRGVFEDV